MLAIANDQKRDMRRDREKRKTRTTFIRRLHPRTTPKSPTTETNTIAMPIMSTPTDRVGISVTPWCAISACLLWIRRTWISSADAGIYQ